MPSNPDRRALADRIDGAVRAMAMRVNDVAAAERMAWLVYESAPTILAALLDAQPTHQDGIEAAAKVKCAFVCVDPDGQPYWPSALPTEKESRRACFGPADDRRLDDLACEGWRCVPVYLDAAAIRALASGPEGGK